ncbi:hypothetical protein G3B1_001 [Escherichia phage vB_EcoS-G3B1]|nr:hypothetical protein G3B1_001 [Escherichia phage vB_EcoS-G3B1]
MNLWGSCCSVTLIVLVTRWLSLWKRSNSK